MEAEASVSDLLVYVGDKMSADWRMLGTHLGIQKSLLDEVEHDQRLAKKCFQEMIEKWLMKYTHTGILLICSVNKINEISYRIVCPQVNNHALGDLSFWL